MHGEIYTMLSCPEGYRFSLSGLSAESEKEKLLCVLCVSSLAGGENYKNVEMIKIKD
jgi:hypothetical protein